MTPVKHEILQRPPETYGDCHRAAVASLLDLPLHAVPHFMNDGADGELGERRLRLFLGTLGLRAITMPLPATTTAQACEVASWWCPDELFLLGGTSRSGCGHTVVAGRDGIVHDPHPNAVGIVGPMSRREDEDCAYFWITFILGKVRTS